jgi:hypothetical protein
MPTKHYALALMFSEQESDRDIWISSTLTAAAAWPILVDGGGVPPLLGLVCLSVWAIGCLVLGLVYGTRKRWAAIFDGYAFRKYCEGTTINSDLILENKRG